MNATITKFGCTFEWFVTRKGAHSVIMPMAVYRIDAVDGEFEVAGADNQVFFTPRRYASLDAAKEAVMEEYGHVYA